MALRAVIVTSSAHSPFRSASLGYRPPFTARQKDLQAERATSFSSAARADTPRSLARASATIAPKYRAHNSRAADSSPDWSRPSQRNTESSAAFMGMTGQSRPPTLLAQQPGQRRAARQAAQAQAQRRV